MVTCYTTEIRGLTRDYWFFVVICLQFVIYILINHRNYQKMTETIFPTHRHKSEFLWNYLGERSEQGQYWPPVKIGPN
jgi:hypothetical protein